MRTIHSLNQDWTFIKAEHPADGAGVPVTLPHTWNAEDGQDGGDDYYRGKCWYLRDLDRPEATENSRIWLEFEGAAMTAEVYLNGEKLADRKSTRLNSSHFTQSRMPSSA